MLSAPVWGRLIGPIAFGLALIAIVELAIQQKYQPNFWQKTTWLVHDPYRGETFDRTMLFERLSNLADTRPEIISVGDSSGFFGIQSKIVNRYTHGAYYLSTNTGANYAYLGYRAVAEYMLRRPDSRIKWVVIYAFPQLIPGEYNISNGTLSSYVSDSLVGPLSVLTPPSAFLSPYAKFKIFDDFNWHFGEAMTNQVPSLQLRAQASQSLGWLPEFDERWDRANPQIMVPSERRTSFLADLGFQSGSFVYSVYDDFNKMVKRYGAHLAIAFAPISERELVPDADRTISEAEASMARFSRDNPDVKFLFPMVQRWHPEKFSSANHVSREYTFLSSMRLGRALGRLVTDPDSFSNYTPQYQSQPVPPMSHEVIGPADPEMLKTALALYLYTQTLDEEYKKRISARVLHLLESDEAYQYMQEDARALHQLFAERKIELGFDLSQMRASPVRVSGMVHCNPRPDTLWVQVGGVLNFTYKAPDRAVSSPVNWPETSSLLFPLIKEDGIYKFDGYCPENDHALTNRGDSVTDPDQQRRNYR